jgi:hypothetical protein
LRAGFLVVIVASGQHFTGGRVNHVAVFKVRVLLKILFDNLQNVFHVEKIILKQMDVEDSIIGQSDLIL